MALIDVLESLGSQESLEQVGDFVRSGAVPLLIELINTRGISEEGKLTLIFLQAVQAPLFTFIINRKRNFRGVDTRTYLSGKAGPRDF